MASEEKTTEVHIEEPTPAVPLTAETLGVDAASFEKYHKDGQFNWEGYAKELSFKAEQAANKEAPPEPAPPANPDTKAPQHSDTPKAQEAVENAGLNWDDLGAKIAESGDIADSDYDALARIGVPKEVVENYVTMTKQQSQDIIDSVIEMSGGQDRFNSVYDALQSKPMEVRNKIDTMLVDPATRQYGIDMMFKEAGMDAPTGTSPAPAPAPARPTPGTPNNRVATDGALQPFQSFDEQVAAQRDPRYKSDPAYRDEVMRRALAGNYVTGLGHTGGM